jgi:uncharacterized protein YjbI with pentapeptide repeats
MKVFKPQKLSFLIKSFVDGRHPFLSVGVLSLHRWDGALLSEMEMWKFLPEQLGAIGTPDVGMVKSRGEFLVSGAAYAPGGQPTECCEVSLRVGDIAKRLVVHGDRSWDGDEIGKAEPFASMPLTWANSFGGEGLDRNPLGKGFAAIDTEAGRVYPLPNVESPGDLIRDKGDRPEPTSFGPIDFLWPQRQSKAGTYDDAWLRELFPGHAADMDWSIFNLADEDQQLDFAAFTGDENFELCGMHPKIERQQGSLPRIAARCFIDRQTEGDAAFEEVPLALTTVWFFPAAERYLLIHHGAVPVAEDDAADVRYLMIAGEDLGASRSIEHYLDVFALRTHPEHGTIHSMRDEALLPERPELLAAGNPAVEAMDELLEREDFAKKYQQERDERQRTEARARVVAEGLDPDVYCPTPEPQPEIPDDILEAVKMAERLQKETEVKLEEEQVRIAEEKLAARAEVQALGLDPDLYFPSEEQLASGPPTFSAVTMRDQLRTEMAQARAAGCPIPELEAMAEDPRQFQEWQEGEEKLREGYRMGAHHQPHAASRLEGEQAAAARAMVEQALAEGAELRCTNLTGADLSGLDFSGRDLSGSWMESCDLRGANFTGANLTDAVLARADLTGANLSGVEAARANLGLANLEDANVEGANLEGAILSKATLRDTRLVGAKLAGAEFMELEAPSADLSSADLSSVNFIKTDLRGLKLTGANLEAANFIECDLGGVDLSSTNLDRVSFVDVTADGARFDGASLCGSAFVMACSFKSASFVGATLESSCLRGHPFVGADFSGATLKSCDLSGADLTDARLVRTAAAGVLMIRTNLSGADLTGSDFMGAILQKADLTDANLSGVNLYGADVSLVRTSAATIMDGTNQNKARTIPELRPLPEVPDPLPWTAR